MKKQFLLFVLMLLPIIASADAVEIDGIKYELDATEKTASVVRNSYTGNIVIPSSITYEDDSYAVVSIGESAFSKCKSLYSVSIPNSVTSIGSSAFHECYSLTSISIPNSVTSIGVSAFYECSGLTAVYITDLYAWCNIKFEGYYSNPCYYAHHLFLDDVEIIDLVIPNGITNIEFGAFNGCSGLTSVIIPDSVTSIGGSAFEGCRSLTSVSLPNSVTSIGSSAFHECYSLTSISIPNSVTTIGNSAFSSCRSLTSISIPNSVTSIGKSAFSYCRSLTSISIPNSVTSIGDYTFKECISLASATIGHGVTSIGQYAFSECSSLTTVSIPNSVTSLGEYAFSSCSSLSTVSISNSMNSIGNSAFMNCDRLTTVYCLNPTPPTCSGLSTFVSTSTYLRDKYDVYNYATLHVPMGSGELYSSAYEWRYFNKIKEDMELDDKVYYARLTVKQGTTGYTSQPVKASETYTIYIGSLGENKVNAVTFNGEDVTDEIKNGYYTTPEIKGESELSISYVSGTALNSVANNNTRVTGYDGEIRITNIDSPSDVFVYTVDGQLVGNITSAFGNATMSVSKNQVYLVKIGTNVYKLAM